MTEISRNGLYPSLNRKNFGLEIITSRSFLHLSRSQLAEAAKLSHDTIARAEKGDESVTENALSAIQRALEVDYKIEFPDGTSKSAIRIRNVELDQCAVCADPSMPSMTRFIAPVSVDSELYRTHPLGERCFKINESETYRIVLNRTHDGYEASAFVGERQVTVTHSVSRHIDLGFAEKFGDSYVTQLVECVEDDIKNRRLNFWAKIDVGDTLEAIDDIKIENTKVITNGKQYKVTNILPGRTFIIYDDANHKFVVDNTDENYFLKFKPVIGVR